jgi:uncharacterized protein YqgC (DUF456 family)
MDKESAAVVNLIVTAIRILVTIYCVRKAGELNRSKWGWGIFGFFLPPVGIIWIQFMKPITRWEQNPTINTIEDSGQTVNKEEE